jgi:hypothetical protein
MWRRAPRPSKRSRRRAPPATEPSAHNNPLPVSPPGQRCSRLRRPALLPEPGRRLYGPFSRGEQPVQRRTGARQGRVLRARAQKRTLPTTQLGIFRKNDLLEVVFNPSPDKPEKRILGPAPSCQEIRRSTGVQPAQPRRQAAAKLTHSIGRLRYRQFRRTKATPGVGTARVGTGAIARPGRAKLGKL